MYVSAITYIRSRLYISKVIRVQECIILFSWYILLCILMTLLISCCDPKNPSLKKSCSLSFNPVYYWLFPQATPKQKKAETKNLPGLKFKKAKTTIIKSNITKTTHNTTTMYTSNTLLPVILIPTDWWFLLAFKCSHYRFVKFQEWQYI